MKKQPTPPLAATTNAATLTTANEDSQAKPKKRGLFAHLFKRNKSANEAEINDSANLTDNLNFEEVPPQSLDTHDVFTDDEVDLSTMTSFEEVQEKTQSDSTAFNAAISTKNSGVIGAVSAFTGDAHTRAEQDLLENEPDFLPAQKAHTLNSLAKPLKTNLFDPLTLALAAIFLTVIALMVWQTNRMQAELIESTALQQASSLRDTMVTVRSAYSENVVARVKDAGGLVSHDFQAIDGAIPIPATMTILLGEKLSEGSSGEGFRLFSDYPFPWRTNGGPQDAFETEALAALKLNPSEPFYRIETLGGEPVLRYARADLMEESCVDCHNSRADSPKTDWKVGDVRGVMEVNLPLNSVASQAQASFRTMVLLIIAVVVLALLTFYFFVTKTRQTNAALMAKREQEIESERLIQEEIQKSLQERQAQELDAAQQLQRSVENFLDVAMDIADGDFTKRGQVSNDALGNVVDAINVMVEDLSSLLKEVQTSAQAVNQGAAVMTGTTESIVANSQQQVLMTKTVRKEMVLFAKAIQEMALRANASAKAAALTLNASQKGELAVTDTLEGMQGIRDNVQSIASQIALLEKRSEEILVIVDSVTHISSQVNLLALSAALEAAGAGDAGVRFAAVAQEVQRLADQSSDSTHRISELVEGVRKDIKQVSLTVQTSREQVDAGYNVASEAGQRLKEIGAISQRSAQLARFISQSTKAQVTGVSTVSKTIAAMSEITQQSQPQVLQGKSTAEQLRHLAEELSQSLARFRLG